MAGLRSPPPPAAPAAARVEAPRAQHLKRLDDQNPAMKIGKAKRLIGVQPAFDVKRNGHRRHLLVRSLRRTGCFRRPAPVVASLTLADFRDRDLWQAFMPLQATPGLAPPPRGPYVGRVGGNSDYGDKRTCNNRLGPGGGTRRLHQTSRSLRGQGAEIGSTNDQRGQLLLGEVPPLSVHDHSCQ